MVGQHGQSDMIFWDARTMYRDKEWKYLEYLEYLESQVKKDACEEIVSRSEEKVNLNWQRLKKNVDKRDEVEIR